MWGQDVGLRGDGRGDCGGEGEVFVDILRLTEQPLTKEISESLPPQKNAGGDERARK